jgi:hypothetical protein
LYASWRIAPEAAASAAPPGGEPADHPLGYVMLGPGRGDAPRLEPGQRVWEIVSAGDSLRLRAAALESAGAAAPARAAGSEVRSVARHTGDRVRIEALLPVAEPRLLRAGGELLVNLVLLGASDGTPSEWGWSSSLDMQPLENPLLWGRARLEAR